MWERVRTRGDVPVGVAAHSAVVMGRNIYILGGLTADGATNSMYRFNTGIHMFSSVWEESKLQVGQMISFCFQNNADGHSWSLKGTSHPTALTTPCVCCRGKCVTRKPTARLPQSTCTWPLCLEEWTRTVSFITTVSWLWSRERKLPNNKSYTAVCSLYSRILK